jgi:hypothetical protein
MDLLKMLGIKLSDEQKKELSSVPKRLKILEMKIDYIYNVLKDKEEKILKNEVIKK